MNQYSLLRAGVLAFTFALAGAYAADKPNVIVIISDDAGFADFGFMDGLSGETSQIPTPNLDSLAARGVTFSNAYTAMVCSPSRAALTTGGYQQRVGYEFNINNLTDPNGPFEGLPVEATTIWERMKSVGYTTGAVGKWHIGSIGDASPTELGNRPQNQGVDEFYGIWRGSRNYNVGNETNTRALREVIVDDQGNVSETVVESQHAGEYVTETFGQFGVDFIADHHDSEDPFFLYQAYTAPHTPLGNSPDVNDPRLAGLSGNRLQYASMMLTMDNEIGRMLDALEDPNGDGNRSDSIADNTMVVFINDNGGASNNASDNGFLRGFKDSPYEGGIRVPMVIAGAGVSANAVGSVYDSPVHSIDILPTAFAAGGGVFGPEDTGVDGVNLLPYINGDVTDDPHRVLVVRKAGEVGVRMGDWKLVKNGTANGFELYNLGTDVGESNNVASSNPEVVAELQRELTHYEVEFDKPRFATLDASQDTVNIFDHFTFRPSEGVPQPGPNLLSNPGFEEGAQLDGSSFHTFEELTSWSNDGDLTSPAKDEIAARDDTAAAGAYRGMLSGLRTPLQVTEHLIAIGDEYALNLTHTGQFSGWDVGSDSFNAELFYLDEGGEVVVLDTVNVVPGGSWQTSTVLFDPIDDADAVGQPLGVRFDSLGGDSEFAGLDEITLGLTGDSGVLQANWSTSGVWYEGGTENVETMFTTDAFAGAVIEFPALSETYIATNDMTRVSGLEFMLNKIVLGGFFGGEVNYSGTINGNDLLFTADLNGAGPEIAVDAGYGRGTAEFTFHIDANLVLYDDLAITGDSTSPVEIGGVISDYDAPRGLTKQGTSVVTLKAVNTYQGETIIEGGVLALAGEGALVGTTRIEVRGDAVFDVSEVSFNLLSGQTLSGDGGVVGDLGAGSGAEVSPGLSVGRLEVDGAVELNDGSSLQIEIDPNGADQLAVVDALTVNYAALTVSLIDGAQPWLGDAFEVLSFASASGTWATINLPQLAEGLGWNTAELLTTGVLSVVSELEGDYNGDGVVDAADYTVFRDSYGEIGVDLPADGDGSGEIDSADLDIWRDQYGASIGAQNQAIPEPASLTIVAVASLLLFYRAGRV